MFEPRGSEPMGSTPRGLFEDLLDFAGMGAGGVGTDFVPKKRRNPTPEELKRISDLLAVEAALAVQRLVYQEEGVVKRRMAVEGNKLMDELDAIIKQRLTAEAEVMASLLAKKGKAAQVLARQQYQAGQANREEDQRKAALNAQRNAALQKAREAKATKAAAEQAKVEARRKTALKNLKKANKARRK